MIKNKEEVVREYYKFYLNSQHMMPFHPPIKNSNDQAKAVIKDRKPSEI